MGSPRSSNQRKITIAIIAMLIATLIVTAVVMIICGKNDETNDPIGPPSPTIGLDNPQNEELAPYIVHTWVRDGTDTYESRVYRETKQKDYYVNDEYNSNLEKIASLTTSALGVEDFTVIDKNTIDKSLVFDITELDTPIQPLTYESNISYSSMYVLYLISNDWEVTRQAVTPTYCEIYLQSGEELKRVIIFKNSLMTSDVSSTELPSIDSYFK